MVYFRVSLVFLIRSSVYRDDITLILAPANVLPALTRTHMQIDTLDFLSASEASAEKSAAKVYLNDIIASI